MAQDIATTLEYLAAIAGHLSRSGHQLYTLHSAKAEIHIPRLCNQRDPDNRYSLWVLNVEDDRVHIILHYPHYCDVNRYFCLEAPDSVQQITSLLDRFKAATERISELEAEMRATWDQLDDPPST